LGSINVSEELRRTGSKRCIEPSEASLTISSLDHTLGDFLECRQAESTPILHLHLEAA